MNHMLRLALGISLWVAQGIWLCTVWWPLPAFTAASMAANLVGISLLFAGAYCIFGRQ